MIGYLKGSVLDRSEGRILVGMGSNESTIGYSVLVPNSPEYLGFSPGRPVELFVHTHVREDALDLYGFASRTEKELFLTLLSVTGIGPKGALGILSKVSPEDLLDAIVTGDKDSLVAVPGIGKKTAERVVMELADTVRKKMDSGVFSSGFRSMSAESADKTRDSSVKRAGTAGDPTNAGMIRDAKTALMGLGYREQDVGPLLHRVMGEAESRPRKVEELIRKALQQLV